jgi:hypothetical protein
MSFSRRRVGAVLALVLLLSVLLVPAVSAAPTASSGPGTYYWVRYGDTLYRISARFGVAPAAIAQANGIHNWNKIYAGQRLWIPYGWSQPNPCGAWGCGKPGPCGWSPCKPPPPPPPPPPQPGPCGWNPCPPQPQPGPCGYNPCPQPSPCGWNGCLPPLQANWQGNFYNSTDLSGNVVYSQNFGTLNFNWNGGSPGPNVNSTNWSARFTTGIWLQGGRYRVQVATDDGARVFVDGTQVINGWNTQPVTVYSQDVWVGDGNHNITVEYYNAAGLSELHFAMVRQ